MFGIAYREVALDAAEAIDWIDFPDIILLEFLWQKEKKHAILWLTTDGTMAGRSTMDGWKPASPS